MEFTSQAFLLLLDSDLCAFKRGFNEHKKESRYEPTCYGFLTHGSFKEDGFQISKCTQQRDIQSTTMKINTELYGDKLLLIERFRSNQEETTCKPDCFGNLTHHRRSSSWNQYIISSHQEVMLFTTQVLLNLFDLDLRALKGELQPNQKDLGSEPTYYGFLRHQRYENKWNWFNINCGYGVMEILNRSIPDLPYLEPPRYESVQTYLWRPGELLYQLERLERVSTCDHNWNWFNINYGYGVIEFLNQSIPDLPYLEPPRYGPVQTYLWRPGELLYQLERLERMLTCVLSCTNTHRIRRILSSSHLPYLETITSLVLQRLYSFQLLKATTSRSSYINQRLPTHGFAKKISRYKLPYPTQGSIMLATASRSIRVHPLHLYT